MMNRWLREITDIAGVEGVVLVSEDGQIIEKIGIELDKATLSHISTHVLRIIASFNIVEQEVKEIELIWSDYQLLAMSAGTIVLIIFCGSIKALSLLRITINVVVAHLLEDKKSVKQIKKYSSEKGSVLKKADLDQIEINLISKLQ
jgi:predicted regulator of Ras-like GTPase activity (Roadblock/LC7/MglB family)